MPAISVLYLGLECIIREIDEIFDSEEKELKLSCSFTFLHVQN